MRSLNSQVPLRERAAKLFCESIAREPADADINDLIH